MVAPIATGTAGRPPIEDLTEVATDEFGNPVSSFEVGRQKELQARSKRMEGWQKGAPGRHASVNSLLEDVSQAKDHGDTAMIGADLLCLGAGVVLDGRPG